MVLMEEVTLKVWSVFAIGIGAYAIGIFIGWLNWKPKKES